MMQPSSTFCRDQEAIQRARAANAELENIRVLANGAAAAWAKEASEAERREARHARLQAEAIALHG